MSLGKLYPLGGLTSGGLTKDGDPVGIAAKEGNVVANPFERQALVSQTGIPRAFFQESVGLRKSKD